MLKTKLPAVAAALIIATASFIPAAAEIGGLVQPADFLSAFDMNCAIGGPRYEASIQPRAKKNRWDELGGAANGKGWMISVNGSPIIIDIATAAPAGPSCSVSAITVPSALLDALTKRIGRSPDNTQALRGQRVETWNLVIKGKKQDIILTSQPNKPMARLTYKHVS